MSDNWIILIPDDPRYVSDDASRKKARDRLAELARTADEIVIKFSDTVDFSIAVRTLSESAARRAVRRSP
jgi:hypothetical protein